MFDDYANKLAQCGVASSPTGEYRPPTIKQRLEAAEKATLDRAKAIQEAKDILTKYPDIERLLDILQKGSF